MTEGCINVRLMRNVRMVEKRQDFMKRTLSIAAITLVAVASSAQWLQPQGVPAYSSAPVSSTKIPHILAGKELANFQYPVIAKAYQAAAKVPKVLQQLPCYCYCDRNHGHKSLHTCFESDHGANCATCMKEAFFAEQETRKGKTPTQIRAAIIRGDFEKIDLVRLNSGT
jgi:hypothetical protein